MIGAVTDVTAEAVFASALQPSQPPVRRSVGEHGVPRALSTGLSTAC